MTKTRKKKQKYPPGWNETRGSKLGEHYDKQTDDEAVAGLETAPKAQKQTLKMAPTQVGAARRQIRKKKKRCRRACAWDGHGRGANSRRSRRAGPPPPRDRSPVEPRPGAARPGRVRRLRVVLESTPRFRVAPRPEARRGAAPPRRHGGERPAKLP